MDEIRPSLLAQLQAKADLIEQASDIDEIFCLIGIDREQNIVFYSDGSSTLGYRRSDAVGRTLYSLMEDKDFFERHGTLVERFLDGPTQTAQMGFPNSVGVIDVKRRVRYAQRATIFKVIDGEGEDQIRAGLVKMIFVGEPQPESKLPVSAEPKAKSEEDVVDKGLNWARKIGIALGDFHQWLVVKVCQGLPYPGLCAIVIEILIVSGGGGISYYAWLSYEYSKKPPTRTNITIPAPVQTIPEP